MANKQFILAFILSVLCISCTKKEDIIEIYLTKNSIESYDGVPLRVGIKDSVLVKQVLDFYGKYARIDTVKDKIIYMGHFKVTKENLEEKPFINDSEILGFDFDRAEMHFSENVTKKIYDAIPTWHKNHYFGKQFALCHNGKIILSGYLYPSNSKFHSTTYQIQYHPYPAVQRKDKIKSVAFWVQDSLNFEKNQLLNDTAFYNIFKNRLIK